MVGLVDREREIGKLEELWKRPGPALALIYGRRRVGKTYFLQHALRQRGGVYFLAAESSSAENLEELLDQVRRAFPERRDATLENYPSWRVALRLLCELASDKPLFVAFDEFSYLCHVEQALPSLLQAVWDRDASASQLKLVLCGSEIGMLSALDDYGRPAPWSLRLGRAVPTARLLRRRSLPPRGREGGQALLGKGVFYSPTDSSVAADATSPR